MPDTLLLGSYGIDILPFLPDPVICADENGRIVLFNRAAEQCFGYTADEIVGQQVEILIPVRFRSQHAENVQEFSQSPNPAERTMGGQRMVWGLRRNGEEFPAEARISREIINGRVILTVVHRDVTERAERDQQRDAIAHELDHRIKNVFAVIGALVALTAKNSPNVEEFRTSLMDRLDGLAATQSFLLGNDRGHLTLDGLLRAELAHYCADDLGNLEVSGPAVELQPSTVQPLALAIHELATNSAKYGAFSEPGGLVVVDMRIDETDGLGRLELEWRESDGPQVRQPDRIGFGSLLVDQMIRRALHGDVQCNYRPEGLVCRMSLPVVKNGAAGGVTI